MNINWDEKPEWADVWIEDMLIPNSSGWHKDNGDRFTDADKGHYIKNDMSKKVIVHYPPETKTISRIDIVGQNGNDALAYQSNPPASSLTSAQQRQMAIDTGRCSDGSGCGNHIDHFSGYCEDCPNDPDHIPDAGNMIDMVSSPAHYQSEMGIECIMAIRAQMTADQFAAYCQGNIVKYLWRWREKGGIESLKKAKWYLYRMIAELEDDTTA